MATTTQETLLSSVSPLSVPWVVVASSQTIPMPIEITSCDTIIGLDQSSTTSATLIDSCSHASLALLEESLEEYTVDTSNPAQLPEAVEPEKRVTGDKREAYTPRNKHLRITGTEDALESVPASLKPKSSDVLLGRGRGLQRHPGNCRLRGACSFKLP